MPKSLRVVAAVATPLAVLAGLAAIRQSASADPLQPQPRAAVAGSRVADLAAAPRTGAVPAGQRTAVSISVAPRDGAALDGFIAQVSDPRSAQHGRYLSPAQFADRFGATAEQIDQLTGYLRGQGLTVDSVNPNGLLVNASGPASAVERAFATNLSTRREAGTGREYYANDSAPTLPTDLATVVTGVAGLDNRPRVNHPPVRPRADVPGMSPAQLKGAYNVNGLGVRGDGQQVALLEFDGFEQSNIDAYDRQFGLSSPAPIVRKVDGGVPKLGEGQVEVELDIEAIRAIAPNARQVVFEGPNTSQGLIDTYAAIVNSGIPVVSISWGLPEPQLAPSDVTTLHNLYKQAAAQGQSLFAASGDNGSDDEKNGGLAVDYPASDPFVTGTGGTHLTVNPDNTRAGETGWSGAGGGNSALFTVPDYQAGKGKGQRMVPDIAADADPASGLTVFSQGKFGVVGGTSAAAPEWAGFVLLYNQIAASKGKPALGFANPALYAKASSGLHDIVGGSNGAFQAVPGYDQVTGLGSYDAVKLVAALLS
ncbi:S53 family serine peptidase [Kutzneria viridogrisea]|uniref:Kumamolisin n=1 Tax=Kutzneria viridogrisea TaxID=47990 RepID=A0ABR6BNZ7_9PSEU|nr:kumamolisin [Kutzneria viridogrisea]